MTKRKLRKAFNKLDVIKKNKDLEIPGILGFTINGKQVVEVANRAGYVWVRIRSNLNEVVQAFNDQVSPVYGLPVVLIRDEVDRTRYKIKAKDLGIYQSWGNATYLPRHGNQHSFNPEAGGGGDVVFVYGRQFVPLSVQPSGSNGAGNVIIQPHTYYQNTQWRYAGGTGTASLLTYKPTGSSARMVLVYLDGDGNPGLEPGSSYFSESITGTSAIIPYLPSLVSSTDIPLAGVRLVSGTTSILWQNIYDLRPILASDGFIPTGTTGHEIQDDGSPLAQRAGLNFVGSNFVVYNTAGETNISGTAVGGSGGIPERSIPVYERSSFQVTGTILNFTDGFDVIVSGSVAHIKSTGTGGGGGGSNLAIFDDSVYKTTGTAISFDKDLSVAASGTFAYVNIPAGTFASGSHTHPAGATAIQIYEDSVYKATGTLISFNNNLDVIVTGTSVFINSTASGGGSNLLIYDDGVFKNTGTAISFDKDLSVAASGTVAYVDILAGTFASGSHTHPAGAAAINIFEDSVFKTTGTAISFNNNLDVVVTGTVAFINSTGGGGGSTYTSTFANRPSGTVNDGDLFFPSDGFSIDRVSGSSSFYQPFGPISPFVAPISSDFTWINQGSGTIDTTYGGIILTAPNGSTNIRLRKKSAPSTPYSITIKFLSRFFWEYGQGGLYFRQSSDGKLTSIVRLGTGALEIQKWNSPSSFSANYATYPNMHITFNNPLMCFKIRDDGTTRYYYASNDGGVTFWEAYSVGRTDFLTADEIGFGIDAESPGSGRDSSMVLLSWEES